MMIARRLNSVMPEEYFAQPSKWRCEEIQTGEVRRFVPVIPTYNGMTAKESAPLELR